ncbi:MAG: hypothetical protein IKA81_07330 [Alistipes sp.]|nr:hypothetical protein [Alistipes sp.]
MKRLFSFWAILVSVLFAIGCDNTETPTPPTPDEPNLKPEITLTPLETTAYTFTFDIQVNEPCEYGYYVASSLDTTPVPDMPTWFDYNKGEVESSTVVTIENLTTNTPYTLYVVARSIADGELSAVKTLEFTTEDDGKFKPIEIISVETNSFTFKVNIDGRFAFLAFEEAYLSLFGTAENYLTQKNILEYGPKEIVWEDGGTYGYEMMTVKPNMNYIIVATACDENGRFLDDEGNFINEVYTATVTTKSKDHSQSKVEIQLNNITSTSVDIKAIPDDTVSTFYIFVQDTETFEKNLEIYGEGAYMSVMKSAYSWSSTTTLERTWGNLTPSTPYNLLLLVVDRAGGEAFSWIEFTTLEPSGPAATLEAELVAANENPHKTLELRIKTNGTSAKYAFNTTADVNTERKKGMTDNDIAANRGAELTAEQMSEATSTGVSIKLEELWPETEYTAIVRVLTAEKIETVKALTFTTPAKPLPARVESSLFEKLVGEWEVSYSYIDYMGDSQSINGAVVRIAAGVDDVTSEVYRSNNRLVILDWPYQSNWEEVDYTSFTPKDLMNSNAYWKENPNLAYRDYGPKVFLEIGNGDTITMPTEKNSYFFNPKFVDGYTLYFFGTDYAKGQNAPCAFPVTLSNDGNTLTIGAYVSGAEFYYGTYRPAVWYDEAAIRNCATSDIVLRRVTE